MIAAGGRYPREDRFVQDLYARLMRYDFAAREFQRVKLGIAISPNAYLQFARGETNIAYYGSSVFNVLHVAKKGGGNGPDCQASSKLGANILMAHQLRQLEGERTATSLEADDNREVPT